MNAAEAKPAKATADERPAKVEPAEPPTVPDTGGLSTAVGADIPELRKRRAKAIRDANERDKKRTKAVQEEAKDGGMHVAKLDDAGAAEQQRAARENAESTVLDDLDGPPVVAPVIEEGGGSIKLVSRRDEDIQTYLASDTQEGSTPLTTEDVEKRDKKGPTYSAAKKAERFVGNKLYVQGDGFPFPGEVIVTVQREDGQDRQRFSTWTEDGSIDIPLPGINGPGSWEISAETLVTQVGEGREDGLPLIKTTDTVSVELY